MYFYQNSLDLVTFLQYAESLGCAICNYQGTLVDIMKINEKTGYLYIRPQYENGIHTMDTSAVYFVPTYRAKYDVFQPGKLSLLETVENDEKDLKSVYRKLCKYIKERYILSDGKDLYISPGFYQDYNSYKVMVPFPLQYKRVVLSASQFSLEGYLQDISRRGYIIEKNGVYEDDPDGAHCKDYVFHLPDARLRKYEEFPIYFFSDSECVFLFNRKAKNELQYHFYMDARLLNGSFSELEQLFDIIEEYVR
jgi:hypothetical protein